METIAEISKDCYPKHRKYPQCKMTVEGIEIKTCCNDFKKALLIKLKKIIK